MASSHFRPKRDSKGKFALGGAGVVPPKSAPFSQQHEAEVVIKGKAPLRAQSLSAAMDMAEQLLSDGIKASVVYPARKESATGLIRQALSSPMFRLRPGAPSLASPRDGVHGESVNLIAGTVDRRYIGRTDEGDLVRVETFGVDEDNREYDVGSAQRIELHSDGVTTLGRPWGIRVPGSASVDTNNPF